MKFCLLKFLKIHYFKTLLLLFLCVVIFLNLHSTTQRILSSETSIGSPFPVAKVYIAVMTNNRSLYLKSLLESLSEVEGIGKTSLIFSHNVVSPEITGMVATKFGAASQLGFPLRLQLFNGRFPGQSPNDCPRDATKEDAEKLNCTNWQYPDHYGHYREASASQIKLHFWWLMSYIYHEIVLKGKLTNGYIIILEEDSALSADMLYILQQLDSTKSTVCPSCDMIVLGSDPPKLSHDQLHAVSVIYWCSYKHFRGIAFTEKNFYKMFNCSESFCNFDDYNPDWSLQYANLNCFPEPWKILTPKVPRVVHVGTCGLHHNNNGHHNCLWEAEKARNFFSESRDKLFNLIFSEADLSKELELLGKPSDPVGYGGWADDRDKKLCMNIAVDPLLKL